MKAMPQHEDRRCKFEECELRHCRQCGGHNFEPGDTCDACQIENAADATERIVQGFGGNSEAAARFMGW